jgi:hypothetical protein
MTWPRLHHLPTGAVITRLAFVKARVLLAISAVVVIAFAVYWLARGGANEKPSPAGPQAASSTTATPVGTSSAQRTLDARTPARPHPTHTAAERAAMLEAIAIARSHRSAAPPVVTSGTANDSTRTKLNIIDKTGDTSEWEKRALDTLNTLLGECYDLGRAEEPGLAGTLRLRFTIAGEPKVGGMLEHVEIVAENTSITQQTIRDCVTEQLYSLELDPPPDGMRVERELALKFP